ncbi:hypothetical protein HKT18_05530 [Flavobacterium sp. IMCC34852]|uniref:Uncharacterized protein n=1 Tax=Flavobacterium rivulicola TaxID=2732161 RepID=A0A7Y3VYG8_9FLAO|nr:hypothetical protein [Flavobacterium sp. IMCC34852]NNT71674.1 hypothetical protein [Flavobacterium sp. IMCC34852]
MKKIITILLIALLTSISSYAQDVKKEIEKEKTKMDVFASKTGTIIKFTDYNLNRIKTSYASSEARIRKISSGTSSTYFFQIVKSGQYSNSTASIEYSDLLEVIKALSSLKNEVEKDITANPDYLENKFTTVDGFKVGYLISKGKVTWYIQLEKYGSDNTLFIDKVETIEASFEEAKNKMEELKK